eukprot:TRINITY_DN9560_c0_g1_i1.p1 TRINITY_DN9560_c0_g1~~TRINITY_DN9560_c0_g1_i1.p1  ORF type:complete len:758 (-),score=316.31 TRINITY_DN9560_c0_g1_i1:101-2374(-)
MAPTRMQSVALLAAVGVPAVLAQDRPTHEEWKNATAEKDAEAAAAAAKESKMAAVNKVISLLDGLKDKVAKEGEKEAWTYNKFACFCKDTTSEKSDAIQKGTDEQTSLSSNIEALASERDQLDKDIEGFLSDIETAEKAIKDAQETRAEEAKEYEKNAADLESAKTALMGAIQAVKASQNPSLVQLHSIKNSVQQAIFMADALGMNKEHVQKVASFFLQQAPDVPMEDYKFHSGGIIETLEGLLKDFRKSKNELDEEEVRTNHEFETNVMDQTHIVEQKNRALEKAKSSKANKQSQIGELSSQRTTVAATVLDDQKYLAELHTMCADKAATWDQRTKVRADELSAITSALAIVKSQVGEKTSAATMRLAQQGVAVRLAHANAKNEQAMEAAEADAEAAEAGATSFLQQAMQENRKFLAPVKKVANELSAAQREALAAVLRKQGANLKSTLLTSLVSHAMEDPFAKVKTLIEELITRLQSESAAEAEQKAWCDKSTSEAKTKRDAAAESIAELNGQMAEQEAVRDKLQTEVDVLKKEIDDLKSKQAEATSLRETEKSENEATVTQATEGKEAVESAITILKEFYEGAAKEEVKPALVQKGPGEDAPDAGFDGGEAYKGAAGTAEGVIGMLDVIKSDFERTVAETEKEEAKAEEDHQVFMADTDKSIEEKSVAEEQKNTQLSDTETALEEAETSLKSHSETLNNAIKELLELKPTCIDTGMGYDDRVARREEEIAALREGLCILTNFDQYAPNSAVKSC